MALHQDDLGNGAQALHDLGQVVQILHFQHIAPNGQILLLTHGELQDVHIQLGQGLRDVPDKLPTILGHQPHAGVEVGVLAAVPADFHHAVRVLEQLADVGAVAAMHLHATARDNESHNLVARQGLATAGELDDQVAHALDAHGAVAGLGPAPENARQKAFRRRLLLGRNAPQQIGHGQVPAADGRRGFLPVGVAKGLHGGFHIGTAEIHAGLVQLPAQHFLTQFHGLAPLALFQPALDAPPGLGAAHNAQPVQAGGRSLGGDDLHRAAAGQGMVQRHNTTVLLGANAAQAHIGVHGEGEINGRGTLGQLVQVTLGAEDEDLVLVEVDLEALEELLGAFLQAVLGEHLLDPREEAVQLIVAVAALLVNPVGGQTVLGNAVHFTRADLHLQGAAARTHHLGVQALVAVGLGGGNVVAEALVNGHVLVVHHAQGEVAVLHLVHQDAHGEEVQDLLEGLLALVDFAPDGIEVLGAAENAEVLQAVVRQALAQWSHGLLDDLLALLALQLDLLHQFLIEVRLQHFQAQILQLPLDGAHAETVGQWSVDLQGLTGDALGLLGLQAVQGAHVVQAVGELHEDHADVPTHAQEHLAVVHALLVLKGAELQVANLRNAVHEHGHMLAEALLQQLQRYTFVRAVLDGVVQEPRDERVRIHLQMGQDARHLDGVVDVGHARVAQLPLVHVVGKGEGRADAPQVGGGQVFTHQIQHALQFRVEVGAIQGSILRRRDMIGQARAHPSPPSGPAPGVVRARRRGKCISTGGAEGTGPSTWCKSRSLKRPMSLLKCRETVPVGPLRCLPMITSARPAVGVPMESTCSYISGR